MLPRTSNGWSLTSLVGDGDVGRRKQSSGGCSIRRSSNCSISSGTEISTKFE